jgi:two-component system KDP operon response regulator KdpE
MNKKKSTILAIDSDIQSQKMLTIVLDEEQFNVVDCLTGKQAIQLAISIKPDLVLLDLNLPDMEGGDLITALREWTEVPTIIISSRSHDEDVVKALNMGANDYVIKPFNADVLLARINASLRVSAVQEAGKPMIANGPLIMDLVRHEVKLNETLLHLTPKEYNLLRYFMLHRGKMLSHREILKAVWGSAHGEDTQYLRVFVGQLREKIEKNPSIPSLIITEPGVGYRMEVSALETSHEQSNLPL